ncbi:MAG: hypothetical protein IJS81_11010 [Selenomonadaceae bacterium]|nr:hypothetical protein [Selenomonadaceae bacterium]
MKDNFFISCKSENHWQLDETYRNDEKIISLKDEYKKYWKKIVNGENFALVRYADGERALMTGKKIIGRDFWQAEQGLTVLGRDLKNSLGVVDKNFVYGISCPCCDSAAYYWYLRHLENCNVTFSNIWVNANFAQFWEDFHNLERDAVLITNYRGQGKSYGRLNVIKHYLVGDDCVNFWEQQGQALIQKIISEVGHEKNLLFAVSAGPLSELIIKALYENNPANCYIDFGSALDLITHGQSRASYVQSNSPTENKNC